MQWICQIGFLWVKNTSSFDCILSHKKVTIRCDKGDIQADLCVSVFSDILCKLPIDRCMCSQSLYASILTCVSHQKSYYFSTYKWNFSSCWWLRLPSIVSFDNGTNPQYFQSYLVIYLGVIKEVPFYTVEVNKLQEDLRELLRNKQEESKNMGKKWAFSRNLQQDHFRASGT